MECRTDSNQLSTHSSVEFAEDRLGEFVDIGYHFVGVTDQTEQAYLIEGPVGSVSVSLPLVTFGAVGDRWGLCRMEGAMWPVEINAGEETRARGHLLTKLKERSIKIPKALISNLGYGMNVQVN